MTLTNIIERSEADREKWKYTELDELKEIFASAYKTAKIDDLVSSFATRAELNFDSKNHNFVFYTPKDRAQIVFFNGILQDTSNFPSNLISGDQNKGYHITISNSIQNKTLELLFLGKSCVKPTEINTNLHIDMDKNSKLTIIEKHEFIQNSQTFPLANIFEISINLGINAKLIHGKIVNSGNADLLYHFAQTNVQMAESATYDNFTLLCGNKLLRNEIYVTLAGEKGSCSLSGIMPLCGNDHADITTCIIHAAPNCASNQHYRFVLGDNSRGVFQGKTIVNECAQKADARQACRALFLSQNAEMNAKPELEIYANDIKCNHGCAIGDLDKEILFYLQSRGLKEKEARSLLVEAFLNELIDEIKSQELHRIIKETVSSCLML